MSGKGRNQRYIFKVHSSRLKRGGWNINLKLRDKVDFRRQKVYHQVLLAKNSTGLKNLYKLVSNAHINFYYRKCKIGGYFKIISENVKNMNFYSDLNKSHNYLPKRSKDFSK